MQKPDVVLNILTAKASQNDYTFNDLYKHLCNEEFYLRAYSKIHSNPGNMTPGADGKTIDGFSINAVQKIISSIRDLSYQPNPARKACIPKKSNSGKKRPLGLPAFTDKLVQEVVRSILEAIYEPSFLDCSHGFRPNKSCKTLLDKIYHQADGTRWWIEGDIKGFFDNIDHQILISIIRRRIKDERFINLLWKFLKAGYVEDWKFHNTYSGTPQGGIISPILSNILLHELDAFATELSMKYTKGASRKDNLEYTRIGVRRRMERYRAKLKWSGLSEYEKRKIKINQKELFAKMIQLPSKDPLDPDFRRCHYYRYADDFLVAFTGPKSEAEDIKKEFEQFLRNNLKLELSEEKTLITHGSEKARFLGYDIFVNKASTVPPKSDGVHARNISNKVMLSMPHDKIRDYLSLRNCMVIDDKGVWKSTHRTRLSSLTDLEVITIYNAEIRGIYNYYNLAHNVSKLNGAYNIMLYSCIKTLGAKHRMSVKKVLHSTPYRHLGRFGVWVESQNQKRTFKPFYNGGFPRVSAVPNSDDPDLLPNILRYERSRSTIEQRLAANACEWCNSSSNDLEVHHIRKLKDLKGKEPWEIAMIARKRKTMVLCVQCHRILHQGKLKVVKE